MSQDDIDRLINEKRIVHQEFDDADVAAFWSKAITAYGEINIAGASTDTRLQIAFRACLQATLAVLAASGLRPKSTAGHFTAFYALQKLDEVALRPIAIRFDELRSTRAESIYEPTEDEADFARQLRNASDALRDGLPVIHAWMVKARPSLDALLSVAP